MKLFKVFIQSAIAVVIALDASVVGANEQPMTAHADDNLEPDLEQSEVRDVITEWLVVAVPPSNVLFGTQYAYNDWGQLVGETMSGQLIEATPPVHNPDDPLSSFRHVWKLREKLDSVEHCTLEGYVTRVLSTKSISDCAERYNRTIPDLTALSALAMENSLEALGLKVEVLPGELAPSAVMVGKVQRHKPNAYTPFTEGDLVTVWLFTERDVSLHSNASESAASKE